jgi:hypothetical protein
MFVFCVVDGIWHEQLGSSRLVVWTIDQPDCDKEAILIATIDVACYAN